MRALTSGFQRGQFSTIPMGNSPTTLRDGPSGTRELQKRGQGPPVTLPLRHKVEVRRSPVLDERRSGVPSHAAIELLDVAAAARARADEVALVAPVGIETEQILRHV